MDGIDFEVGNFDYNAQAMIDFDMAAALAEFGVNDTILNETAALMDDALGSLWGSGNTAMAQSSGLPDSPIAIYLAMVRPL